MDAYASSGYGTQIKVGAQIPHLKVSSRWDDGRCFPDFWEVIFCSSLKLKMFNLEVVSIDVEYPGFPPPSQDHGSSPHHHQDGIMTGPRCNEYHSQPKLIKDHEMPTGFGRDLTFYVQNLWARIVLSDLPHSRYTSETNECPPKKVAISKGK